MTASRSVVVAITAAALASAFLAPASVATAPVFEPASCPFVIPRSQLEGDTVDCGYLVVPEDRSDPSSDSVRIATAVFRPPGGATHPDPVVYLEGGPGGSPLKLVGTLRDFDALYGPFIDSGRDVILIDQRGVGYSEPALECPAFSELYLDLFDQRLGDQPERLSGDEMRTLKVDALAECAEDLRATAALGAYNTKEIAADIEDLRRALGYEQLNLWGTSYGTWAALDAMRDHPDGIRSVILDAPLTPEADPYVDAPASFARALDEVFQACAEDPACAEAYPDLPGMLAAAVEQLDQQPVAVDLLDPIGGQRVDLLLDGSTFLEQVFRALYQAPMRAALPKIIDDARSGVFDTLLSVAQLDVLRQEFRSWGMYYSVLCHDEVPFSSIEALESAMAEHPGLADMYADFELGPLPFELCPRWDAGVAASVESEPVESDIPVLVTTGQYDPIVPPSWGLQATESLTAATFHLFPGLAHGVSGDPCATEMMLAFLDEPTAKLDASCMASMAITPFDLPVTSDAAIALEPFISEAIGLEGVRPSGWDELAVGQFARRSSGTDPTSLVLAALPLPIDEALALLTERFGMTEAPPPLATFGSDELEWTHRHTEAQGLDIDFAMAPSGGSTLVAILTSNRADRDHLVGAVLRPVAEGLKGLEPK